MPPLPRRTPPRHGWHHHPLVALKTGEIQNLSGIHRHDQRRDPERSGRTSRTPISRAPSDLGREHEWTVKASITLCAGHHAPERGGALRTIRTITRICARTLSFQLRINPTNLMDRQGWWWPSAASVMPCPRRMAAASTTAPGLRRSRHRRDRCQRRLLEPMPKSPRTTSPCWKILLKFSRVTEAVFLYLYAGWMRKAVAELQNIAGTIDEERMQRLNGEAEQTKDYARSGRLYWRN